MSQSVRDMLRDVQSRLQTALDTLAGPSHAIPPSAVSRAKNDIVALIGVRSALQAE